MKAKFIVTYDEMVIYREALRDNLLVSLPGVNGKHVMNGLEVESLAPDSYELIVEYGKAEKRGKKRDL